MAVTRATAPGRAYLDLQNRARREGRPTQQLLTFYVLERFLARLAMSPHRDQFILKGGLLLAVLDARRATQDADLLAVSMNNDRQTVAVHVIQICRTRLADDDGVTFLPDTLTSSIIREQDLYAGVRIEMDANIARARVKLKLDINVGDPVTPAPAHISYPTLRDGSNIQILGYPLETVLAEKVCTAVGLGAGNSRVRDYVDIWNLTGRHTLGYSALRAAIEATARYRQLRLSRLSEVIGDLAQGRRAAYRTFRAKLGVDGTDLPADFSQVLDDVVAFSDPLLDESVSTATWNAADRSWQDR